MINLIMGILFGLFMIVSTIVILFYSYMEHTKKVDKYFNKLTKKSTFLKKNDKKRKKKT